MIITASERADAWDKDPGLDDETLREAVKFAYASPDGTPAGLLPPETRKKILNRKATRRELCTRMAHKVVRRDDIVAASMSDTPWVART